MAPTDTLNFQCVAITGGAGGLGRALAEYFLKLGKKVIIAGRTESKLQKTSKELGDLPYYVVDTSNLDQVKTFAQKLIKEHPEIDAVVANAGVQLPLDVNNLKLEDVDAELRTNAHSPVHLATHLLDHFKSKPAARIFYVSSVLGFAPFSILNPVYNGTKAFIHFWAIAQRVQLKETNVRVIELVPPSVATELHRSRVDPKDSHKNPESLRVEQWISDTAKGLESNADTVSAGPGIALTQKWDETFGQSETMKKAAASWKGFPTK
ncbi:short-chain dehydrogenase [Ceraceosorus bombacis]|uniref:Short-chain dehydrogenase n=1 Tax=Ceraceosorus bombacis TaxID=401625 RepID=A0A0P1BMZ8_9BASI|nr:short-chain dehydrogenase [Ceraceosorus bombacis]